MALRVDCPGCGGVFMLPNELTGKKIRCQSCREVILVNGVPEVELADEPAPRERIQATPRGKIPPPRSAGRPAPSRQAGERAEPGPTKRSAAAILWVIAAVLVMVLVIGSLGVAGIVAIFVVDRSSSPLASDTPATAVGGQADQPVAAAPKPRPRIDGPPPANGQLPGEMLDFLKGATVYIKADAGRLQGSGSGFLIKVDGDTGYIVTNEHVAVPEADEPEQQVGDPFGPFGGRMGPIGPIGGPIGPRIGPGIGPRFGPRFGPGMQDFPGFPQLPPVFEQPRGKRQAKLTAVLGSGTPNERSLQAEILDADEGRDLAILRVRGANLPTPLDLIDRAEVAETSPVYVVGFPLGDEISLRRNPEVTIGPATVTSLRKGKAGTPMLVQLQGDINPGNSGGPVVDHRGRLVGVTVAKIKGTQIGFAIAPEVLQELLRRAKSTVNVNTARSDRDGADVDVEIKLLDLFDDIREVRLSYVPGIVATRPQADGAYAALGNGREATLKAAGKTYTSRLTFAPGDLPNSHFTGQLVYVHRDGSTRYGKPFNYRVTAVGRNR